MTPEADSNIATDALRAPETVLTGKTAIVTGGSRDIGSAIVRNLAQEGVNVVFIYKSDTESAESVLESVAQMPGHVQAIRADLEKPEDRTVATSQAIELLGGEVDFLVLNTSGRNRAINQENSDQMITESLPHIKSGGTIVRMTSAIAHFGRLFEDDPDIPTVYHKPATAKNEEEAHLRGRIGELDEQEVRLIMIAPPGVPSRNRDIVDELTKRATKNSPNGPVGAIEIHNGISDKLKIPREVSQDGVAAKIVELLKNPDIKSGYTELWGVHDALTDLARVYDIPQIYVSTLETLDDLEGKKHTVGRSIASVEQATRSLDPSMVDRVGRSGEGGYIGSVLITPDHASGHFSEKSGLPRILPGHKLIRSAIQTIEKIENEFGNPNIKARLKGFEQARFEKVVLADGDTILTIVPTLQPDGRFNVDIYRESDGEKVSYIEGLEVSFEENGESYEVLEDQLIEGAAQTVGLSQASEAERKMPLLAKIGKTEFVAHEILSGNGVSYDTLSEATGKRGVKGSVHIFSDGRIIGGVEDIEAVLIEEKTARRALNLK